MTMTPGETLHIEIPIGTVDKRAVIIEQMEQAALGRLFDWPCPNCGAQVQLNFDIMPMVDMLHCAGSLVFAITEV